MSAAKKRTTYRACSAPFLPAKVSIPKAVAWSCLELCADSVWVGEVRFRQQTCQPVISRTPAQQVCLLNNSTGLRARSSRWGGRATSDRELPLTGITMSSTDDSLTHGRFSPLHVRSVIQRWIRTDSIRLWKEVHWRWYIVVNLLSRLIKVIHLEPGKEQRRHEQEGGGNGCFYRVTSSWLKMSWPNFK